MNRKPGIVHPARYAWVSKRQTDEVGLDRYLPGNYEVVGCVIDLPKGEAGSYLIAGEDFAGWTLDDYVIPRLASGLITAVEIPAEVGRQLTEGRP